MSDEWQSGKFLIAYAGGPAEKFGHIKGALAVYLAIRGSPKGRRPPTWALTHIATGHLIAAIEANGSRVFELADMIGAITDWDAFDSLKGWKNTDPQLPDKLVALVARYPDEIKVKAEPHKVTNEAVAQTIARAVGR